MHCVDSTDSVKRRQTQAVHVYTRVVSLGLELKEVNQHLTSYSLNVCNVKTYERLRGNGSSFYCDKMKQCAHFQHKIRPSNDPTVCII